MNCFKLFGQRIKNIIFHKSSKLSQSKNTENIEYMSSLFTLYKKQEQSCSELHCIQSYLVFSWTKSQYFGNSVPKIYTSEMITNWFLQESMIAKCESTEPLPPGQFHTKLAHIGNIDMPNHLFFPHLKSPVSVRLLKKGFWCF